MAIEHFAAETGRLPPDTPSASGITIGKHQLTIWTKLVSALAENVLTKKEPNVVY